MNIKRIFDFLYPKNYTCVVCGDDVFNNKYYVCKYCLKTLPFLTGKLCKHCSDPMVGGGDYCKRCKAGLHYYDRAISPFVYKDTIAMLIQDFKYNNKKYLAKTLASFMSEKFKTEKLYVDIIVPVPLCEKRLKLRGFNQSALLANEISYTLNVPAYENAVVRVKETLQQTKLNIMERQSNLKDAFVVKKKKMVKGKSVLLIDDVYTTGATSTECARMLKLAGASAVYVLTVAHTVKDDEI